MRWDGNIRKRPRYGKKLSRSRGISDEQYGKKRRDNQDFNTGKGAGIGKQARKAAFSEQAGHRSGRGALTNRISCARYRAGVCAVRTDAGMLPEKFSGEAFLRQIGDELLAMVESGGRVLDVVVEHDVYGQIRADLNLATVADVKSFCARLARSTSGPLFPISDGIHLHTVEAASESVLDEIEMQLRKKGYLL